MRTALPRLLALACLPAFAVGQATWSHLYPAVSPPARSEAVMACHESTGDVVLLSGIGQGFLSDAWRLQDGMWAQMTGSLPPARSSAAMVYDSVRQRLVLFGGQSVQGNQLQDTWEWNGATWSQRLPTTSPVARQNFAMAFDPDRAVTVLFGGYSTGAGAIYYGDVWEWDGVNWSLRALSGGPSARASSLMAFDPVRGTILLHGGTFVSPPAITLCNDTWSWSGSWQQRFPMTPPPRRVSGTMVCDSHRQRILLFGGTYADMFAWEWDGYEWNPRLQASPGPRSGHAMAYDATRRRAVVFGGMVGSSYLLDDTWTYRTPNPADVAPFGAGCAGTAGVPQLANAPYSLPWLGDTFTNRVTNLAPAAAGVVFATGFSSTPPISLASFGMPGCDQLVIPAVSEFRVAAAGAADWTLTIPNTTTLANVHLFQQAFALDAAANAAGLVASNGVEITTGIR